MKVLLQSLMMMVTNDDYVCTNMKLFNSISVPMIKWEVSESKISVSEDESMLFCFSSEITSAIPYQVEVGVHSKGERAAIGKIHSYTCVKKYLLFNNIIIIYDIVAELAGDYEILSSLTFNVSANVPGEQYCVNISITDDPIFEETEQFKLSFENIIPNTSATFGSPDTICVIILDNDGRHVQILGFSKELLHLYINSIRTDVQIGFNSMTYMGSEADGMINITVSILNGTLSQELEVVIGLLTMSGTAKCKTNLCACNYWF